MGDVTQDSGPCSKKKEDKNVVGRICERLRDICEVECSNAQFAKG